MSTFFAIVIAGILELLAIMTAHWLVPSAGPLRPLVCFLIIWKITHFAMETVIEFLARL